MVTQREEIVQVHQEIKKRLALIGQELNYSKSESINKEANTNASVLGIQEVTQFKYLG